MSLSGPKMINRLLGPSTSYGKIKLPPWLAFLISPSLNLPLHAFQLFFFSIFTFLHFRERLKRAKVISKGEVTLPCYSRVAPPDACMTLAFMCVMLYLVQSFFLGEIIIHIISRVVEMYREAAPIQDIMIRVDTSSYHGHCLWFSCMWFCRPTPTLIYPHAESVQVTNLSTCSDMHIVIVNN